MDQTPSSTFSANTLHCPLELSVKSRPTATLAGLKHLVDYLCESTSWQGQRWTRKITPSILIFRNEINALGNIRGGDKLARDFAHWRRRSP
jgi:hypothetical protein